MSKICTKCGNHLSFRESHNVGGSIIAVFQIAINSGLFSEYNDKQVCISCKKSLLGSKEIEYKGIIGAQKGKKRIKELVKETKTSLPSPPTSLIKVTCSTCTYSTKNILQVEKASFTNLLGAFTGTGSLDYQNIDNWICSKFKFDITNRLDLAGNCTSYLTQADYEKKCLSGEMEKGKGNVQIILDFSSLKDELTKGGIVMSTYDCPNCKAMIDLPETGKILICKYCGIPIKPLDVFDKIKTLLK